MTKASSIHSAANLDQCQPHMPCARDAPKTTPPINGGMRLYKPEQTLGQALGDWPAIPPEEARAWDEIMVQVQACDRTPELKVECWL